MTTETPRLAHPDVSDETRRTLLRSMLMMHALDDEALQLARMGHLDLWVSLHGAEASQAAVAEAFGDVTIIPSFREHGVALARGIDASQILELFAGRSFCGWNPVEQRFFPYTLSLAAQCHHGVGYALARKLQGSDERVAIFIGDGAMSEGEASEALNAAATEKVPVIFVCFNNGWALSKPAEEQSATSLATRAAGFGIASREVDGLDPEATLDACHEAVAHVSETGTPYFLELHVVRIPGHGTSDDQTRYRTAELVDAAEAVDPLRAYQARLLADSVIDEAWLTEVTAQGQALRDGLAKEYSA